MTKGIETMSAFAREAAGMSEQVEAILALISNLPGSTLKIDNISRGVERLEVEAQSMSDVFPPYIARINISIYRRER